MQTVTIGNRKFKSVGKDCTLAHDVWVMNRIRQCELEKVVMLHGETANEYAKRFLLQAISNPNVFEMLGGLLMPADVDPTRWTPEMAAQTAEFLANVTDPADKKLVKLQITEAVTSFFVAGVNSQSSSRRSSPGPEVTPFSESEEVSNIPSGAESSAPLHATT